LGNVRPDLLFVTSPPLGLSATAIALSRLLRVPYVLHVADLQPDAAVDLGMLPRGRFIKSLYHLEAAAYRNAALISTLTEAMRQRIIAKGVPAEKVTLFSDWVDPQLFTISPPRDTRSTTSKSSFVVGHFGNMGVKQGLEVVVGAAALSPVDSGLEYLLVGDGAARSALEARARDLQLPNLRFLPLQPHDGFLTLLARADVCLVTQQRSVADIVFPSKIITLLAAARPIVASVGTDSEVARVIAESGGGIIVPPEDSLALSDAVLRLRNDPSLAARMGCAGRAYAQDRWERETVLKTTERGLCAVINNEMYESAAASLQTRGH
jgi:colanic acid biosynthesis glycosyl transferase WcaI